MRNKKSREKQYAHISLFSRSTRSQVISDIPAFALSLDCTIWLAELTVYLGFYLEFLSSTIFRDNLVISCFIQRYFNEGFSS